MILILVLLLSIFEVCAADTHQKIKETDLVFESILTLDDNAGLVSKISLIAYYNGEVCGGVCGNPDIKNPGNVDIAGLFIYKEYQKRGIDKLIMMRNVMGIIKNLGYKKVSLIAQSDSKENLDSLIRFYQQCNEQISVGSLVEGLDDVALIEYQL